MKVYMIVFTVLPLISFVLMFCLANVIFLQDSRNPANRIFSLLCLAMAVYAFAEFMYRPAVDADTAKFWIKIAGFWVFCPPLLLHFALLFTEKHGLLKNKILYLLLYLPTAAIYTSGTFFDFYIGEPVKKYWGYTYGLPNQSFPFCVGVTWNFILIITALTMIVKDNAGLKPGNKKTQVKYIFASIVFVVTSSLFTEIFPRAFKMEIPEMNTAIMTVFVLIIAHGIMKYGFFSLEPIKVADNILSTMKSSLFVLKPDGKIAFVNDAAQKTFLYEKSEMENSPIDIIIPDKNDISRIINPGYDLKEIIDVTARTKTGKLIPVSISKSEIRKGGGRVKGIVVIAIDESEKKKMEESFYNAQKIESLGIMAGGIAHDFNNILNAIFGYCELIRETITPDQKEILQYFDNIFASFNKAQNLTRQMLTFARGGSPKIKTVDMARFLVENSSFAMSGSNIELRTGISENLWNCDVDKTQLGLAFDNIIINSKQAMDSGQITITAENMPEGAVLPAVLKQGKFIRITFTDSGPGIPKDVIDRIFEPFFTTKARGTGLGLTTAYSIVRKHNGIMEAESEPGRGTVIKIYIPASVNQEVVREDPAAPVHAGQGRILLMDDEKYNLDILSGLLGKRGYGVKCVMNGTEALTAYRTAKVEKKGFDLIILDLTVVGGMGGCETLRRILSIDQNVKAVAVSGYSDDPVMSDPVKYGFIGSLAKPYTKMELDALLENIALKSKN